MFLYCKKNSRGSGSFNVARREKMVLHGGGGSQDKVEGGLKEIRGRRRGRRKEKKTSILEWGGKALKRLKKASKKTT